MPDRNIVGPEHIVVGIDENDASDRAVDWVAARRVVPGSRVEFVTVTNGWGVDVTAIDNRLSRAADQLAAAHPRIEVTSTMLSGAPDRMLVETAATADLLVIGSRRQHRVRTALDGWMSERVPTLATGPTVVVPEDWQPANGDVILGVDDENGDSALHFAGSQAVRDHRRLTLIRAWKAPVPARVGGLSVLEDPKLIEEHGRSILVNAERLVHIRFPDLQHSPVLDVGDPADVLERHAQDASLIVLGRHHRSMLGGLFFGSTAHDLITRSRIPVCIAPLRTPTLNGR
ncbi:universal stress protein [Curtobacterium flaccumfaciens pv. oortii]|uniref:universal stress protein n=1 Tax=Curtobacterium flaccumfaciens TaxID=2035 RepID=UPI002658544D|nr:universal stress protein [Curtobacterium flaccumfaciens]MCS5524725.1 universal stress protein [Curtobacterium flaccumfaciens pv. oortii]